MSLVGALLVASILFPHFIKCAFFLDTLQPRKWRPRFNRPASYNHSATLALKELLNEAETRCTKGLDKILLDIDILEDMLASGAQPPESYTELIAKLLNYFRFQDFSPIKLFKLVYHVEFTSNTHLMHAIWSGCLMNVRAVVECGLSGYVPAEDHSKMKCWAFPFPNILFYLMTNARMFATSQDLRNAVGCGRSEAAACILSRNVEITKEVLGQQLHGGTVETLRVLLKCDLDASMFLAKLCFGIAIGPYPSGPLAKSKTCLLISATTYKRHFDMIELLWVYGASTSPVDDDRRFLVDFVQARQLYPILATGQGELSQLLPELRRLIVLLMLNIKNQ